MQLIWLMRLSHVMFFVVAGRGGKHGGGST